MCKLGRSLDNSSLSGVSSYHKSGYTTEKQGMYAVWMKGHILVTLRKFKDDRLLYTACKYKVRKYKRNTKSVWRVGTAYNKQASKKTPASNKLKLSNCFL